MKKYAPVVIAVAALIVVAAVIWGRNGHSPASPDAPDIEPAVIDVRDAPLADPTQESRVAPEVIAPERASPTPDASRSSEREAAAPQLEDPRVPSLDEPCECEAALYERLEERGEAIRQAEPKDTAWAYDTEQLLSQYLAADPNAKVFRISAVDCRTSFCEIRTTGTPEEQAQGPRTGRMTPNRALRRSSPWRPRNSRTSASTAAPRTASCA